MNRLALKRWKNREEVNVLPGYSNREEDLDHLLVRQAQRGDRSAVTALYRKYRGKVLNHLYRFTGNRALAEDLTQETFIRVVQHLPRYRPTGSVVGWIYRIAGNLALNSIRDRKVIQEISLDEPLEMEDSTVTRSEVIANRDPTPDQWLERHEMENRIQQALTKVLPQYREVVILCDIHGYAYKEAADMLDCSINTVASRLARGRAQLARSLGYLKRELG